MEKRKKEKVGFTLIETVIGIAVITLVITATAALTRSSLQIGGNAMRDFVAYQKAEEGLEIIRNMRDSNWLRNRPWKYSLASGNYFLVEREALPGELPWEFKPTSDEAPQDGFIRTISIAYSGPAQEHAEVMTVKSVVQYAAGGKNKTVSLITELTDWKRGPL